MSRIRLKLPESVAKAGSIIEVKMLFSHPMERGDLVLPDGMQGDGYFVGRNIARRLEIHVDDRLVTAIEFSTAIAPNPWLVFPLRIDRTCLVSFSWYLDDGQLLQEKRLVSVDVG